MSDAEQNGLKRSIGLCQLAEDPAGNFCLLQPAGGDIEQLDEIEQIEDFLLSGLKLGKAFENALSGQLPFSRLPFGMGNAVLQQGAVSCISLFLIIKLAEDMPDRILPGEFKALRKCNIT
ncbi:hypothetical protein D3C81_1824830 [compost metagenome]